jgi:hypothetical protein
MTIRVLPAKYRQHIDVKQKGHALQLHHPLVAGFAMGGDKTSVLATGSATAA